MNISVRDIPAEAWEQFKRASESMGVSGSARIRQWIMAGAPAMSPEDMDRIRGLGGDMDVDATTALHIAIRSLWDREFGTEEPLWQGRDLVQELDALATRIGALEQERRI